MLRTTARIAFVFFAAAPLAAASLTTDVFFSGPAGSRDASPSAIPDAPQRRAGDARDRQARDSQTNDEWCRDAERNNDSDNRDTFCEVREFTLSAGSITAETSNGGVRVTGERGRNDILVRAMVVAQARTESAAREIAKEVVVSTSGRIRATGPRTGNRESWWVSFRVLAPQSTDINATSSNGSLSVTDVRGKIQLRTSNGSINLMDVGGDVVADTSNGSVNASLSGSKWEGQGLDISTSNGSVRLSIPDNYNAHLTAGTSNGSINVGFPITVSGRLNRDIDTTLGSGGPTIRVRTSNGSVSLQRR